MVRFVFNLHAFVTPSEEENLHRDALPRAASAAEVGKSLRWRKVHP